MKTCPNCKELNGDNRADCWKCGTALKSFDCCDIPGCDYSYKKICRKCGLVYPPSEEFCHQCGAQLSVCSDTLKLNYHNPKSRNAWLYVLSALIPALGVILGIFYILHSEKELGKNLIVTGVFSNIIMALLSLLLFVIFY